MPSRPSILLQRYFPGKCNAQQLVQYSATVDATTLQQIGLQTLALFNLWRNQRRNRSATSVLSTMQQEDFEERAAIREYDGGMDRFKAELLAFVDVVEPNFPNDFGKKE